MSYIVKINRKKSDIRRFIWEKSLSGQQKHQFQKSTKLAFLQGGEFMVLVENLKFCERFRFMENTARKSIW